jgi:hypothetical protein
MEDTNEQPVKLNSKGKPYKNGVGPSAEQLLKLANMRAKASEVLSAKGKQTVAEKVIYEEAKANKKTPHMIAKKERAEVVNEIIEEKKQTKKKPVKPVKEESDDSDEEIIEVIKKKKKKARRKIIYESSSDDESNFQRKPRREPKEDYQYQQLLQANSNRLLEEKLLQSQMNSFSNQMKMTRL